MSDTYLVEVGPKGRVVIPAELRRRLDIAQGTQLVALHEAGGVLLLPRTEVKRRLRRMFSGVRTSMARELIHERRSEAARETTDR